MDEQQAMRKLNYLEEQVEKLVKYLESIGVYTFPENAIETAINKMKDDDRYYREILEHR